MQNVSIIINLGEVPGPRLKLKLTTIQLLNYKLHYSSLFNLVRLQYDLELILYLPLDSLVDE